jgi:hypothetical protein
MTLQGIVFPESVLESPVVAVLAAFVAINTLVYTVLALGKVLPKVYLSDLWSRPNRRSETRSIDPDAPR